MRWAASEEMDPQDGRQYDGSSAGKRSQQLEARRPPEGTVTAAIGVNWSRDGGLLFRSAGVSSSVF